MLGCLIEKQRTTPEQYPLTLNALRLGVQPGDEPRAGAGARRVAGPRRGAEPGHARLGAARDRAGLAHPEVPAALLGGARPAPVRGVDPGRADAPRSPDGRGAEGPHRAPAPFRLRRRRRVGARPARGEGARPAPAAPARAAGGAVAAPPGRGTLRRQPGAGTAACRGGGHARPAARADRGAARGARAAARRPRSPRDRAGRDPGER